MLQLLGTCGEIGRMAQSFDEAPHKAVELAAQRMIGIAPRFLDERRRRGHDLAQEICVGAIEVEQRRQFLADLFAQGGQCFLVGQHLVERNQKLVQQPLVASRLRHRAQEAGRQRRQLDPLEFRPHPFAEEGTQT